MEIDIILNITANLMGAVAIILSTWAYMVSKREATYGDLDSIYLEVLKEGLNNPKYRNINYTNDYKNKFEDENEIIAYETYAFIAINWCETCIDRVEKNKQLIETWYPAVEAEFRLHKNWMNNPENHFKFKDDFRNMLNERFK